MLDLEVEHDERFITMEITKKGRMKFFKNILIEKYDLIYIRYNVFICKESLYYDC